MKKNWKIAAVVVVAVALFAGAGTFAMAQTTETPVSPAGICGGGLGLQGLGADATVVTDLLGLTADQIRTLRAEGKSLAEIAATKGVSEDALVAAILKAHQDAVNAAVTAGRITQAQAELVLENMELRIRAMVTSSSIGPFGMGPGMGFGGCRGAIGDDVTPAAAGFGGMRGFGGMMGWR